MKFFSLDTVLTSFSKNTSKTSDGFWGIMAFLRSIDSVIKPGIPYSLNPNSVADILEGWFSIRPTLKTYNSNTTWFVVFSADWASQLSLFLKEKPNIYNVIAWMYQNREFESEPTHSDLLSIFLKDTTMSIPQLEELFDTKAVELKFSDSKYTREDKIKRLETKYGKAGSNNAIKSNGSYIVSEAGAFQRAPFTQTLYAGNENFKCLLLTTYSPSEYYPENFGSGEETSDASEGKNIIDEKSFRQFVRATMQYLYNIDAWGRFFPQLREWKQSGDSFRWIADGSNIMIKLGDAEEDSYWPELFDIEGTNWRLNNAPKATEGFPLFAKFIKTYYPSLTAIKEGDTYKLVSESTDNSFSTSNNGEFWNYVGKRVLEIDRDFSRLPKYRAHGHIRALTEYGSSNYSIGYYDKKSGRVDSETSFNFFDSKREDVSTVYYIYTEPQGNDRFDRFVPVFNKAYQGVFEIGRNGDTYYFKDLTAKPLVPYTSNKPRQVIFFGAPGTGKSHAVDLIVKEQPKDRTVRTTFHPDSDYSSFVGCYKPTMRDGNIEYAFTPQAFVNAYVGAWSDLSKPFYLVIEEINRGNCAQIFGDIFQLLDRTQVGESSYEIKPDTDLQAHLAERLGLIPNIPADIASGNVMKLPRNLFILATMNTSDQSLFPIDSAFKRRWDWRYTAIKQPTDERGHAIDHILDVNGQLYNWTSFISKVNKKILDLTKSEDKQLGYWFIKPGNDRKINWELFVSKALFYIWNDVVKDYAQMEKESSAFGKSYAFTKFFDDLGNPSADMVVKFLEALEVEKAKDVSTDTTEDAETPSGLTMRVNGKTVPTLTAAIYEIVNSVADSMTYSDIEEYINEYVPRTDKPVIKTIPDVDTYEKENQWYKTPIVAEDAQGFVLSNQWKTAEHLSMVEALADALDVPFEVEGAPISDESDNIASEPEVGYGNNPTKKQRDNTKYRINGQGEKIDKKHLASQLVEEYIRLNPNLTAQQVVSEWKTLGDLVSHFIETQAEFETRTDSNPRVSRIMCNGEIIYVSTNGWGGKAKMQELKEAVESKDWGLKISEA